MSLPPSSRGLPDHLLHLDDLLRHPHLPAGGGHRAVPRIRGHDSHLTAGPHTQRSCHLLSVVQYRVAQVVVENLLLSFICDVPPSCLGSTVSMDRIQGLSATPVSSHLAGSRNKHFYSPLVNPERP